MQQQDVYEIMCRFIDLLCEPATTLFWFETERQIECCTVQYGRQLKNERFSAISLEIISNQSSVSDIIKQQTIQEFKGNDQWDTLTDHGKQDATLKRTVVQAPTVLQLHLKRFSFDGHSEKALHRVTFEQELSLETSEGDAKYGLSSVLVHRGTLASGHFYSCVKKSKSWFRCDDGQVIPVSDSQAINDNFGGLKRAGKYINDQPTAYVLIYVLVSADDSSVEPVISEDMQKKYETCVQQFQTEHVNHLEFLNNLVKEQCMHCWYVLETLFQQSSNSFQNLFDNVRLQSDQNGDVKILTVEFDPDDTIESALTRTNLQVSNEFDMLYLHLLRERSHSKCQSEKNLNRCSFAATVKIDGIKYHLQSVAVHLTGKPYVVFTKPKCWPHWFRCNHLGHIYEVGSEKAIQNNFGGMTRNSSKHTADLIPSQSTAQILIYVKEPITVPPLAFFESDLRTPAEILGRPTVEEFSSPYKEYSPVTDNDFSVFGAPSPEAHAAPESLLKFVVRRNNPLQLQGWLNDDHVSDCLSMFAILREDTLFISPMHCYSISLCLDDHQNWPQSFTRFVSKYKFNYVVAMLSIGPSGEASQMSHSQETRLVASVGKVSTKQAWHYDPAKPEVQQQQSALLINILSAVMTYKTGSEFKFKKTECPVKFRCQPPSDNSHCGILSLVLIQNWCTRTLAEFAEHVKDFCPKKINSFAEKCRVNLIADLEQGVADSSIMFCPQTISISSYWKISSFWTVTRQMHFAYCLRGKFGCDFQEQVYQHGIWTPADPDDGIKCVEDGNPRESVHFFTSRDSVVKVYRIMLGLSHRASTDNLAKALHEASATAYVCPKYNWRYEVFGIVTQGVNASYLHVCILRTLLNADGLSIEQAKNAFILLLNELGIAHGDPHAGNAKMKLGCKDIEVFDFERSFMVKSENKADILETTLLYVRDANARFQLLKRMMTQGMDDTRNRFRAICEGSISHLLTLELEDFLKIFLNLFHPSS